MVLLTMSVVMMVFAVGMIVGMVMTVMVMVMVMVAMIVGMGLADGDVAGAGATADRAHQTTSISFTRISSPAVTCSRCPPHCGHGS